MGNPAIPPQWKEVETAARSLGLQPQLLDARKPEDLGPAFDAAIRQHADALIVGLETLTLANQRSSLIGSPASLPAIRIEGVCRRIGCLWRELCRRGRAAASLTRSSRRNPADLPVEQPTRLEFVINLKTATPAHDPALCWRGRMRSLSSGP
jgi:putative ABC transport system substrate-binding protein